MTSNSKGFAALGRITWTGLLTLAGLGVAYTGLVAWGVALRIWSQGPLDWSVLRQAPWDPDFAVTLALISGSLVLDLLANGWSNHPLRRLLFDPARSDRTDLFYTIAGLIGVGRLLAVLMSGGAAALLSYGASAGNLHIAASLPIWVAVAAIYIGADFLSYWCHRMLHSRLFWPLHAVHHAAEDMNLLATFRHHPAAGFLGDLAFVLPVGIMGFSEEALAIASVIMTAHALLIHSNLPFPAWLEWQIAGPRAHRIHHATDKACHDSNFGALLIWDHMFGTYRMCDVTGLRTGISDPLYTSGRPLREMFAVMRYWLSGFLRPLRDGRTIVVSLAVATLLIAIPSAVDAADQPSIVSVATDGTQFRVTLADGRILRSPELAGAALIIATAKGDAKIRISAVEHDPDTKSGDVWLHTMLLEQADGATINICDPGPDGRQQGFPIEGHMLPDGSIETTAPEQFEIVCTSGARGKCVRFGYRPWEPEERALYDACTRMVRADYCGNSVATTRNGMSIDLYDDRRIETADNDPAQEFEAGWTARGAVCVRHVRVKENISLERLAAACPALAGKVGEMCTEASARSLGAILFNRSRP